MPFPHLRHPWATCITALILAAPLLVWAAPHAVAFVESYRMDDQTVFEGQSWDGARDLYVLMDNGGSVTKRLGHVQRLARDGARVHVEGVCASACTLYLALPTTCTHPASLWMFHRPYNQDHAALRALGRWDPMQWSIEWALERAYPEELGAWQRAIPTDQDLWLTGAELVDAGWAQVCPDSGATGALAEAQTLADTWNAEGPLDGITIARLRVLPRATVPSH